MLQLTPNNCFMFLSPQGDFPLVIDLHQPTQFHAVSLKSSLLYCKLGKEEFQLRIKSDQNSVPTDLSGSILASIVVAIQMRVHTFRYLHRGATPTTNHQFPRGGRCEDLYQIFSGARRPASHAMPPFHHVRV